MIPGARLVILGRQGAGKGTQCVRLARHYFVPHISTGEILRHAVKEDTPLGREAKAVMDAGKLVPDPVILGIVAERLSRDDTTSRGYILDGVPRTVGQAEALAEFTAAAPLDLVVNLEVPERIVLERLVNRRVCVDCGTNYSLHGPPEDNWTCEVCGGQVVQRADDTEEAIRERLANYDRETAPLTAWYEARDLLVTVDGLGTADEVTERLIRAIDGRAGVRTASTL
jgi:adenylate kinase